MFWQEHFVSWLSFQSQERFRLCCLQPFLTEFSLSVTKRKISWTDAPFGSQVLHSPFVLETACGSRTFGPLEKPRLWMWLAAWLTPQLESCIPSHTWQKHSCVASGSILPPTPCPVTQGGSQRGQRKILVGTGWCCHCSSCLGSHRDWALAWSSQALSPCYGLEELMPHIRQWGETSMR